MTKDALKFLTFHSYMQHQKVHCAELANNTKSYEGKTSWPQSGERPLPIHDGKRLTTSMRSVLMHTFGESMGLGIKAQFGQCSTSGTHFLKGWLIDTHVCAFTIPGDTAYILILVNELAFSWDRIAQMNRGWNIWQLTIKNKLRLSFILTDLIYKQIPDLA